MSIPNFIRTVWNSKGSSIIRISDINCIECQEEWYINLDKIKREQKVESTKRCSAHSKYITCYMSTLNIWEYELNNYSVSENESANRVDKFLGEKPTSFPLSLWNQWISYWDSNASFFVNLFWIYRFPNLVNESSHLWFKEVIEKCPYLENHLEYYGDIPLISETKLANVDSSKTDEYSDVLNDIWVDLNLKRMYIQFRLYLWVTEYPISEDLKEFFSSKGITQDPSPLKKYCDIVNSDLPPVNGYTSKEEKFAKLDIHYTYPKERDSFSCLQDSTPSKCDSGEEEIICIDNDIDTLNLGTKFNSEEASESSVNSKLTEMLDPKISLNINEEDSLDTRDMTDFEMNFEIVDMPNSEANLDFKEMLDPVADIPVDLKEMLNSETNLEGDMLDEKINLDDREMLDQKLDLDTKETIGSEVDNDMKELSDPETNVDSEISEPKAKLDTKTSLPVTNSDMKETSLSEKNVDVKDFQNLETNLDKMEVSDMKTSSNIKETPDFEKNLNVTKNSYPETNYIMKEMSTVEADLGMKNNVNHLEDAEEKENEGSHISLIENSNIDNAPSEINKITHPVKKYSGTKKRNTSNKALTGVGWALQLMKQQNASQMENSNFPNTNNNLILKSSGDNIQIDTELQNKLEEREETEKVNDEANSEVELDSHKEKKSENSDSENSPQVDLVEEEVPVSEYSESQSDSQTTYKNNDGNVTKKHNLGVSVFIRYFNLNTIFYLLFNFCMNLLRKPFKNINFHFGQSWYVILSPFWWFGYGLHREMTIESNLKSVEKKSLSNFVSIFKPTVRKQTLYPSNFSAGTLHVTKVEKFEDFRTPYENLIKVLLSDNEESETNKKIVVYYMNESDIDYECEENIESSEKLSTTSCEIGDVCNVDNKLKIAAKEEEEDKDEIKEEEDKDKMEKSSKLEDWLYTSTITYDENGGQKAVPNNSIETSSHSKMNTILRNYSLMRFSADNSRYLNVPKDLPKNLSKYWLQRYRLFLKYDEDIKLDHESWFSVTPEMIAGHQAIRCSCGVVVDAFCGAGGTAIQLAYTCHRVIAIDIDPKKIELARHNAHVYGVADRIEFIVGDFFKLAPSLKADVVLLSPPWGGVDYNKITDYDVLSLGGLMDCKLLMDTVKKITPNIALYVPKTSNILQLIELAGLNGKVDIEFNHISNKRKSITAYYGELADFAGEDHKS